MVKVFKTEEFARLRRANNSRFSLKSTKLLIPIKILKKIKSKIQLDN
jgi:hypothetical protein